MGIIGDAWDWTKGAVSDAWDGITGAADDTFSQDKVNAYDPNRDNFYLGGSADWANKRYDQLQSEGTTGSRDQRHQGAQGLQNAQALSGQYNLAGRNGYASQQALAGQYGQQGQAGNALQQARALGYSGAGSTGLASGATRAAGQGFQAQSSQDAANRNAALYGRQSSQALNRSAITMGGADQDLQNRSLETQSRQQQLAAAQALGYQANSNYGDQATQGLRNYAANTGSGPSAAQAQMQQGSDQSMASALALARSGRGNNGQAIRQAQFQNAATQQATNQQLATLRAQEYDQAQNRQLNALNAEQQALQGYRGQNLQALQSQASLLGQARGQDQSQQQLGIGQNQYAANLALQNRQLNDQSALAWAGQSQAAAARGDAAWLAGQQLGNQSIAQGQQYNLGMQGLSQQASQSGQQFELGKDQLANQATGQGQQYQLGMGQLANQATGQGLTYNASMQGLGNQYNLGMQSLAGQTQANALQGSMGYEQVKGGNIMAANTSNAQFDQQRDAANTGMVAGAIGAMAMMSDERSKKDVQRPKNEIFGEALMDASGYGSQFRSGRNFGSALMSDDEDSSGMADARALGLASGQGAYEASLNAGPTVRLAEYQAPMPSPAPQAQQGGGMQSMAMLASAKGGTSSDERSKKEIRSLKGQLAQATALGFQPDAPDTDSLDAAYRRQGGEPNTDSRYPTLRQPDYNSLDAANALASNNFEPRVDLRGSPGYKYKYKDPNAPGAAPGTHYGPMAQDLERSPATAGTVVTGPDGMKRVDTGRLALVNTAALSDQQRDIQKIKQALATNNGPGYDRDALDAAHESQGGTVNRPWRERDPLAYQNPSWRYQPGF